MSEEQVTLTSKCLTLGKPLLHQSPYSVSDKWSNVFLCSLSLMRATQFHRALVGTLWTCYAYGYHGCIIHLCTTVCCPLKQWPRGTVDHTKRKWLLATWCVYLIRRRYTYLRTYVGCVIDTLACATVSIWLSAVSHKVNAVMDGHVMVCVHTSISELGAVYECSLSKEANATGLCMWTNTALCLFIN